MASGPCVHFNIPEPAVSRKTLVTTAGSVWLLVGGFLMVRGALWLPSGSIRAWMVAVGGLILGLLKSRYALSRLASQNLKRIYSLSPQKEKICLFAFQALQSYLVVILMVTLGVLLRHSALPRTWLALIYITIGFGLALSSRVYFKGIPS